MQSLHIFTSAACNYIPKVRLLFQSLRIHHPEAVLHLLLADARTDLLKVDSEPFDVITTVEELGIENQLGWVFCHSIVELATAIKPMYLRKLLDIEGCKKVIYLDPDTVVFSRLDDILDALDEANITLTPHQIEPEETIRSIVDNEISSLKHGVYNLGFIGVASNEEGKRFADWWSSRTYYFCRSEISNGLFTDQRWIDLVPAFFSGVAIQRTPRHNVAPWNIATREINKDSAQNYLIGEEPLGFYHFTGFDSGAHKIMASLYGAENSSLMDLVHWYETSTASLAEDPLSKVRWAFESYTNGEKITKVHRFLYRQRIDLQREFKNPFQVTDDKSLYQWMKQQGPKEYPNLFADQTQDREMEVMSKSVGLIFDPTDTQFVAPAFKTQMKLAITNPIHGLKLVRRGFEILQSEGISGIRRRIK